jgi:cyanocobalamin reductase (cyanide-eliminating) / alkylcobalamin dealkylase
VASLRTWTSEASGPAGLGVGPVRDLEAGLRAAGFDVFAAFGTSGWDDPYTLNTFGRDSALACVVGNSKALWPVFRALDHACADPLDRYVESAVSGVAKAAGHRLSCRVAVHFAHIVEPAAIPIQRVAEFAGLARLGPAWLSVHPEFGPWFGLRAVLVFDVPGPTQRRRAPDLCSTCNGRPCVPAMETALARGARATWRDWLAARDACPVGFEARYGESQLNYHYTKDRAWLDR